MKKFFLSLLLVIAATVSYMIYKENSFSPLNKNDFKKLFAGDDISFDKVCSKDFLGATIHGEIFDFYNYKVEGATIDKDYPKIVEWENKKITNETITGKWEKCPIDFKAMSLYKSSILNATNLDMYNCSGSFKKDIINPKNYYSYIYFSEAEAYFLLYCTDEQVLHYVRLRM